MIKISKILIQHVIIINILRKYFTFLFIWKLQTAMCIIHWQSHFRVQEAHGCAGCSTESSLLWIYRGRSNLLNYNSSFPLLLYSIYITKCCGPCFFNTRPDLSKYSVPLVCVSVFLPIWSCFDYCHFVV